ncbi:MAG TPA: hypothetical protein VGC42_15930 [Kofleriaceae bacterium]
MRHRLSFVFVVAALLAGCKGDPVKCDQGCRNFANLMFWKQADAEIAQAPPTERDALRKKKLAELSLKVEGGIDMCITQCQSANKEDDIDCMIAAKTPDQAQACLKQ